MNRDIQLPFDVAASSSAEPPDRSRLREVFREFELRDPLRRIEEALGRGRRGGAPRPAAEHALSARLRDGERPPRSRRSRPRQRGGGRRAGRPRCPRMPCSARSSPGASRAAPARGCSSGERGDPAELVAALGERPVLAHDAKALGTVPAGLAHDTLLGAYLLEPARRGYPLDELCEERGPGRRSRTRPAAEALLVTRSPSPAGRAGRARARRRLLRDVELPLVARAADDGARRREAEHPRAWRRSPSASRTRSHEPRGRDPRGGRRGVH